MWLMVVLIWYMVRSPVGGLVLGSDPAFGRLHVTGRVQIIEAVMGNVIGGISERRIELIRRALSLL